MVFRGVVDAPQDVVEKTIKVKVIVTPDVAEPAKVYVTPDVAEPAKVYVYPGQQPADAPKTIKVYPVKS